MSLRGIVAALGGDLYQDGRRANIPAPGHGAGDRSVSLWINEGRLVVHCFGDGDWRTVLDDLRRRGLVDGASRPTGFISGPAASRPDPLARIRTAHLLWDGGAHPEPAGLVARHLTRRGLVWRPDILDLREHPAAPLSAYRTGGSTHSAMMARISGPDGDLRAIELTYLEPNGGQAFRLRLSRKTIGQVPSGSAVRLSPVAPAMVVGEGVMTTLSAMFRFGRPGWALLSAGNLARWTAPAGVRDILIAADRGAAGQAAAITLEARLRRDGLTAAVIWPPQPFGDWNEALVGRSSERKEEGGRRASAQRGWAPRPMGDPP